jgi:tripartite-type tricarboxylate transporter receptor subunit TctC
LPVKSVKDLIALAKASPGKLNYGSTGIGSVTHLTGELFKAKAGVNIVHVPYKSWPDEVADLGRGEIQMVISDWGLLAPHAQSGKVKIVAVASAEPSALVPGLPTISASGLPGFASVAMTGLFAPARTPEAIIRRWNQEAVRVLSRPEAKQTFFNSGSEVVGSSSEQFAATVKSEVAIWAKVIKDAGLSPQ